MRETKRHTDAFEYYYGLGDDRNFKLVESEYNVSNMTVARWSKAFNWQARIEQLDKKIAKEAEALLQKKHIEFKRKQYEQMVNDIDDIDKMVKYQKAVYNTALDKDGKPVIKIGSIRDMKDTVLAVSILQRDKNEKIKMAQLLAGDNTDKQGIEHSGESKITIEYIGADDEDIEE